MAPEMSESENYDNKVDVWALGILLYELLHGRPPFLSVNIFDKFKEIENANIVISPNISTSASNLIRNILNKDPLQRPTIHEILKSSWFREKIGCKLRVGTVLVHSELGTGTVTSTQGNICCIEFQRSSIEIVDTEALRLFQLKPTKLVVAKSLEFRNKPPLAKNPLEKAQKLGLPKVSSSRDFTTKRSLRTASNLNTSVESNFTFRKNKEALEKSFYNINNVSKSPIKSRV